MSLIRKHGAVLQAWACLDLVFVLTLAYCRRGRWTDFDAQYVIQRGSAQGSAFWGLKNEI